MVHVLISRLLVKWWSRWKTDTIDTLCCYLHFPMPCSTSEIINIHTFNWIWFVLFIRRIKTTVFTMWKWSVHVMDEDIVRYPESFFSFQSPSGTTAQGRAPGHGSGSEWDAEDKSRLWRQNLKQTHTATRNLFYMKLKHSNYVYIVQIKLTTIWLIWNFIFTYKYIFAKSCFSV